MSASTTELITGLGLRAYLDPRRSLFRRYQDEFLARHAHRLRGRVIEIGGERHNDHVRYFGHADSFTLTNIARDHDEYADVTSLPYASGSVDGFVAVSVLEHVADTQQAWTEMARVLRPGGRVLVATPFLFPMHDEVDYRRPAPDAFSLLPEEFDLERLVHLGGRLSAIAGLCQRPPGKWRRRQLVYKLLGLPVALVGRFDQLDDSPLGVGAVLRRIDVG